MSSTFAHLVPATSTNCSAWRVRTNCNSNLNTLVHQ